MFGGPQTYRSVYSDIVQFSYHTGKHTQNKHPIRPFAILSPSDRSQLVRIRYSVTGIHIAPVPYAAILHGPYFPEGYITDGIVISAKVISDKDLYINMKYSTNYHDKLFQS